MSTTVAMSLAEFLARPEEHNTEWSRGALVVTPQPTLPHQHAAKTLTRILDAACPPEYTTEVLTVFERADQEYVIRATATPGHVLHVDQPFPIDVDPGELLP